MNDNNKAQINLRDILQICRSTLNDLNSNTIFAVMREQNSNFNDALNLIERYLPAAENALNQDKAELGIKTATIFLINLWSKLKQGGSIAELTKDDWNNAIANAADQPITIDPRDYSLMVFDLYRRSIALAIDPMRENASASVINRLEEIVSLMDSYVEELETGNEPEIKFIEENLWLSLEAVFLVLTDRMSHALLPEKRHELAEAVSALVFQKFRYSHYEEELAVIDECLEYQAKIDQRLDERINAYIDALKDELDEFDSLVERAFNTTDFQTAFRGSVELALSTGVDEDKILKSIEEVNDYFMS